MSDSATREIIIESGPVLLSLSDGIADLRLNRPAASNGIDSELLRAMHDALMWCHSERRVKVVVLSGEGKHFCAGGDVKTFESKGEDLPDYLRAATAYLQVVVNAMMRLNAPVIAQVHGFAAGGGGFGFVCAADLVVSADTAKFMSGVTRVGMAPDAGLSVTLQNLVGFRKAMELMLLNPVIDAKEALDLGIVNRVVPEAELAAATRGIAQTLAAGAPLAIAETKRLMWNGMGSRVETNLGDEARTVSALSGSQDALEALRAIIEKRQPRFVGK